MNREELFTKFIEHTCVHKKGRCEKCDEYYNSLEKPDCDICGDEGEVRLSSDEIKECVCQIEARQDDTQD